MAFEVEYFTLDTTSSANKYVNLGGTPFDPNDVVMDLIGGTAQAINNDFGVDGTKVKWDNPSFNLYPFLSSGDQIRIIYDRS